MFKQGNGDRDKLLFDIVSEFDHNVNNWEWKEVAQELYDLSEGKYDETPDACRKAYKRYCEKNEGFTNISLPQRNGKTQWLKDNEPKRSREYNIESIDKSNGVFGEIYYGKKDEDNFKDTFNKGIEIAKEQMKLEHPKPKQFEEVCVERKKDGTLISERKVILSETDMKDDRCVLLAHGFDPDKYDVVSIKNRLSVWDNGNKEGTELQSYQSSLTVKPKGIKQELDLADILNAVSKINSGALKRDFKIIERKEKDGLLLEVTWPDLHIGSLSWEGQVGKNNDYKIAFGDIKEVCAKIVAILKKGKHSKIINAFLGDGFHVDTSELTTAGRTQVDTDSRPEKMILMGEEMFMYIIDTTCIVEDCENVWVGGNHSKLIEFAVFSMLPFVYRENKHIKFNVTPKDRKIITYGKVLVGLLHGDEIEKSEKDVWLQRDFKKEWAECEYAEIHCGHFHQEQLFKEKGGIVQRTNPTLKIQDKYEYDHGWSSNKVILAYSWDKEEGLQEVFYLK